MGRLLHDRLHRHVLNQRQQRVLHQRHTGRRVDVARALLFVRMRRVVRRHDVDAVLQHRRPQRAPVVRRLDRRIALDVGAAGCIVRLVEEQMVHADLGGDALAFDGTRFEQFQFPRGRQVQDMQPAAVAGGEFHGETRRLVAGLLGTDPGMHLNRDRIAIFLSRALLVGENHRRVLAVGRNHQRARRENALQGLFVVHQHVARGRAHEHLDAAGLQRVHRLDRLEIVVGRPEIESVVGSGFGRRASMLVLQRARIDGLRHAVGHLHVARNATRQRRRRLRRDGGLVLESGLAKVDLVVDHPRDQPRARSVDLDVARDAAPDPLDASIPDGEVALDDGPLIDDPGILYDSPRSHARGSYSQCNSEILASRWSPCTYLSTMTLSASTRMFIGIL